MRLKFETLLKVQDYYGSSDFQVEAKIEQWVYDNENHYEEYIMLRFGYWAEVALFLITKIGAQNVIFKSKIIDENGNGISKVTVTVVGGDAKGKTEFKSGICGKVSGIILNFNEVYTIEYSKEGLAPKFKGPPTGGGNGGVIDYYQLVKTKVKMINASYFVNLNAFLSKPTQKAFTSSFNGRVLWNESYFTIRKREIQSITYQERIKGLKLEQKLKEIFPHFTKEMYENKIAKL
mgnify:CR=1 FL=1